MNSSIKIKFDDISSKYDIQRKNLIPCFDDFYNISVSALESDSDTPNILDIGAGTGIFSEFVSKKFPKGNFTLIDLSEKMLDIAKVRFTNNTNIKYIAADYLSYDFKEKYDLIISALSIHHLEDYEKKALFQKIHSLLKPNGIFVNADQSCSESDYVNLFNKTKWESNINRSGLSKEEITSALDRVKLDKDSTLIDQLTWLKEAGFRDTDCIYKYHHFTVFLGKK